MTVMEMIQNRPQEQSPSGQLGELHQVGDKDIDFLESGCPNRTVSLAGSGLVTATVVAKPNGSCQDDRLSSPTRYRRLVFRGFCPAPVDMLY